MATTAVAYSRILLKLSGEALAGDKGLVFDFDRVNRFSDEVKEVADMGVSVGLVIGGGNIVRGSQLSKNGMDRVTADYMGSRATASAFNGEDSGSTYLARTHGPGINTGIILARTE